jgi:hypothetical protein
VVVLLQSMKLRLSIVYILLVLTGIITFYAIFNIGNPNSLFRLVIKSDRYDLYIIMGGSLIVFFLGFLVFYFRQQEGFTQLLWLNRDRIQTLRNQGFSDEQIAEDLLSALGMKRGYRYNMTKKRLMLELSVVSREG